MGETGQSEKSQFTIAMLLQATLFLAIAVGSMVVRTNYDDVPIRAMIVCASCGAAVGTFRKQALWGVFWGLVLFLLGYFVFYFIALFNMAYAGRR